MLFNSLDFIIFISIVFVLYWLLLKDNVKAQNSFILTVSYIFYGWWDWHFLLLILVSTITDFILGKQLQSEYKLFKRKIYLWTSIIINLGILGVFKYYNFFVESFIDTFNLLGLKTQYTSLNIILPIGISFYTFQTLGYTIDVYKKKVEASTDFIAFAAFVSFFPQLVAGPIEKASQLLPQFYNKRAFDIAKIVDGLRQILWGLFKKMVIADNCAAFANEIFNNTELYTGSNLVLGVLFFSIQVYGDFSGYSDIAIGVARLFGFTLMKNFAFPYFSRNIVEFWRKWHISLSIWFKDYVYIPLGGSRGNRWRTAKNILIVFTLSGLWHGANWTYIFWGVLHAVFYTLFLLTNRHKKNLDVVAKGKVFPTFIEFFSIITTFSFVSFALIIFRSNTLAHAGIYISKMFTLQMFEVPSLLNLNYTIITLILVITFMLIEWLGREHNYAIEHLGFNWKYPLRYSFYYLLLLLLFLFGGKENTFIYFQF